MDEKYFDIDIEDDFSDSFYQQRQAAHEMDSPAMELIRKNEPDSPDRETEPTVSSPPESPGRTPEEIEQKKQEFIKKQKDAGKTDEEIQAELGGLEEPWIDPTAAASGGFGGVGAASFRAGMKFVPTLGRAILAAGTGALMDYPVGMATEKVGEKYPKLAMPFNVMTGMVSGMTLENLIEKSVIKAFSKKGVRPAAKLVKDSIEKIRSNLEIEKYDDELTAAVVRDLTAEYDINVDRFLKDNTSEFIRKELTPEKWLEEFGESMMVKTPIGEVKMGENQLAKLQAGKREEFFGLIKPTLEDPLFVLKDKKGGKVFMKTFTSDGQTNFVSVTYNIDGLDVSVSNRPERLKRIIKNVKEGELIYQKTTALSPPSRAADQPTGADGRLDKKTITPSEEKVKEAVRPYEQDIEIPIETKEIHNKIFQDLEARNTRRVRAISGNLDQSPSGVRTLGLAINTELAQRGRIDLRGKIANSAEDVADIAQVYRDPRFETLRIIYVKEGQIVAHEGITSRMPGFSKAFSDDPEKEIWKITDRMKRLNADGYYLLHNHPSGTLEASAADQNLTAIFADRIQGLKAHIIINSGKYVELIPIPDQAGRLNLESQVKPVSDLPDDWEDPILQAAIPHDMLGRPVLNPETVALIGSKLKSPEGYATLLYRDAKGEIRAIQEVPVNLLAQVEHATNFLRGQARNFGAVDIIAVSGEKAKGFGKDMPYGVENELIKNGTLRDIVIYQEPDSWGKGFLTARELGAEVSPGKRFGKEEKDFPAYRVSEEGTMEYQASLDARLSKLFGDSDKSLVEIMKDAEPKAAQFLNANLDNLPDKAININFSRLETSEDIKELIAKTAEIFEPGIQQARRGKVSNVETERLADEMGMTAGQLLKRTKGQAFNAHEAVAARKILLESGHTLMDLARKITEGQDDKLTRFAFQRQLSIHYAVQAQVSGMTAEAGRALQAFQVMARESQGRMKQIDEVMQSLKGRITTEKMAQAITEIDSIQGLNQFAKKVRKANTFDMFMEAWINSLLSGPVTHAVNSTSNALVALWQVPERLVASGISKLTGSQEIAAGEALEQAYGLIEGFKDGIKLFGHSLKTGESSDLFTKIDIPRQGAITAENVKQTLWGRAIKATIAPEAFEEGGISAKAVNLMGAGTRLPGRLLTAEDEFFKAVGYRMELRTQAFRQARAEGLKGDDAARRMQEIIADPPDTIHLAAIDNARYQTFTSELGEMGKRGMHFLSHPYARPLRLIIPFIQTPVNIMKFAGERSPAALAMPKVWADLRAGGARRDLALARVSLGSMVMAMTSIMAAQGHITGGGPSDPEMKKIKRNTGWQPYSLKIGDKYYSYSRLEPLGMLFGIAADTAEIIGQTGEEDAKTLATAGAIALAKNITSKTFFKSLSDAMKAFDDPDRFAEKFLQGYAKSVIPTGVAQIERVTDPVLRETYSPYGFWSETWNEIKSRIPGWSKDLPPRRNLWGEPIIMEGGMGPDIISPIYTSTGKHSPVDEELLRMKIPLTMPKTIQSIHGIPVRFTPKEYDRYIVLTNSIKMPQTGKNLKSTLDRMVKKNPRYKQANDEQKERMIRFYIYQSRDMAREKLYEESGDIRWLVEELSKEKVKMMQQQ